MIRGEEERIYFKYIFLMNLLVTLTWFLFALSSISILSELFTIWICTHLPTVLSTYFSPPSLFCVTHFSPVTTIIPITSYCISAVTWFSSLILNYAPIPLLVGCIHLYSSSTHLCLPEKWVCMDITVSDEHSCCTVEKQSITLISKVDNINCSYLQRWWIYLRWWISKLPE